MRKTLAVATAALVLLAGGQLPAWAAEAPTDVQVGWADAAAGKLKVTWTDGGEANRVKIKYEDSEPWSYLAPVKAGAPNELVVTASNLRRDKVARIFVVTHDEAGTESAPVYSPSFDTSLPAQARFTAAAAFPDGSLRLEWYRGQAPQETTPNDPLDRPSTGETVVPAMEPASGDWEMFPVPTAARTTILPPRPRPYRVWLRTHNEWGTKVSDGPTVAMTTMTAALTIPAVGQYLSTIRFTAAVGSPACASTTCGYGPVLLQARADSTKPWATIGRYADQPPTFSAALGVYGGRQYRLYVPAWSLLSGEFHVAPPISTSARYSAAQAKFSVVGFNTTSAQVGQLVKATVNVLPAGTVKSSLQWYDGKAWHHSTYIPLTKGKGTFTFKAAGRGTTRYWRVVVPTMTMNGLPILATPSKAFKLSVR